jgi:hypothetical protein
MCITDRHPTCYNLKPITDADKPQINSQERGMITQVEQVALGAVDVAKLISEPLDKFDLAKIAIKFSADLARSKRSST